jgi:hypothetical protein
MKPKGKKLVVRAVFFVVCAVAVFSTTGNAETVHGTFKLPVQAQWGTMQLSPGEYEFSVDTRSGGSIVMVRSLDSRWSGMAMYGSSSDYQVRAGSGLTLTNSEGMTYVKALYIGDLGVELNFATPRTSHASKLAKSQTATMASASGAH